MRAALSAHPLRDCVTRSPSYPLTVDRPLAQAAAFASLDQSPTLWWPQDRSWFVCTELDTVATDLGGSEELVAALLAVPGLRVSRVSPDDSVQMPADW